MKGLIWKDLYNLVGYKAQIMYLVVFYFLFLVTSNQTSFVSGMVMIVTSMMVMTSFSYDSAAKWDGYGRCLPISKKETVLSKYLLAAILIILGILLSFIFTFIGSVLRGGVSWPESLLSMYICCGICMIYDGVSLPILIKFGAEKTRFLILGVVFIPTILLMAMAQIGMPPPSAEMLEGILLFIPVAGIILFIISFFLSVKFFKAKEF